MSDSRGWTTLEALVAEVKERAEGTIAKLCADVGALEIANDRLREENDGLRVRLQRAEEAVAVLREMVERAHCEEVA